MKISDLIKKLERFKSEYGDIETEVSFCPLTDDNVFIYGRTKYLGQGKIEIEAVVELDY